MSYLKAPDRIDRPMTPAQSRLLQKLAEEAYQPKQFSKGLSRAEAEKRIAALKSEIELANSF